MAHLNSKEPFPDNKHRLYRLMTDGNVGARPQTGKDLSEIVKPFYKFMKSLVGQQFSWESSSELVS